MKNTSQIANLNGLSPLFRPLLLLSILASLALITLGGVVHNTDSSLACPDWPLCFGQVMPEMSGGVAIEHSHRLLGALVGFLVIGLCALSWKQGELRKRSLTALALVILQGLLGGLTVKLQISPWVSTLHLALSQIFVAYLLLMWVDTAAPVARNFEPQSFVRVQSKIKLLMIAVAALFFQMLLGASLRHGGAGVVCGVGPEASFLCLDHISGEPTVWPTSLAAKAHFFHRFFALVVTGLIIAATIPVIKFAKGAGIKALRIGCVFCHALVCVQVGLGIASVWTGLAVIPVTLHLLVAAALWLCLVGVLRYTQNTIEAPGLFTIASETSKRK